MKHRASVAFVCGLFCLAAAGLSVDDATATSPFVAKGKPHRPPGTTRNLEKRALDCSAAIDIELRTTQCGDNTGLGSQVDDYGCSGWNESAGEVVYRLVLDQPVVLDITLDSTCDLDVALLDACDPSGACLVVADTGIRSTEPVMGEYFIVVDGYNGAECGFCLEVTDLDTPGIDPLACGEATPLSCANGLRIGSTCGGSNWVSEARCSNFVEDGLEEWFQLTLLPGGELSASVGLGDVDAAVWLLDGCGTEARCLAFEDAEFGGNVETLTYRNDGTEAQDVYLVLDSFGLGTCGAFELDLQCSGGVVPIGATSWGTLKSQFTETNTGEEEDR